LTTLFCNPLSSLDPLFIRLKGAGAALLAGALRAAEVVGAEEAWLLESFLVERG